LAFPRLVPDFHLQEPSYLLRIYYYFRFTLDFLSLIP
jgi:hypothetical protein